jgi:hypothetical protein
MDVPGNSLAHNLEITKIERDQEKITNRFQMRAADVCSPLRGKAEPIGFDDVVYILRYRYSTGNLQLIIMPAKQEIVAEVEVLLPAVARDCVRESRAQASPTLSALLPRRNFGHLEARHAAIAFVVISEQVLTWALKNSTIPHYDRFAP